MSLSPYFFADATTTQTSLYKDRVTSTLGASSYILGTTTKLYTDTYVGSASQNWSMIMGAFKPATTTSGGGVAVASTTVRYVHSDHLGSPTVMTNTNSVIAETIDYAPYGAIRFDNNTTSYAGEKRKFTGKELDSDTGLTYFGARYMNAGQGQFTNEDPSFLAVGSKGFDQKQLTDPQQLNSYSYVRNNPVGNVDPDGKNLVAALPFIVAAGASAPVIAGVAVGAGIYLAGIALSEKYGTQWAGNVKTVDYSKSGLNQSPMGPEDWDPKNLDKSKWYKATGATLLTLAGIYEFGEKIIDSFMGSSNNSSAANVNQRAYQTYSSQINSSSIETRYQGTQRYNDTAGATSPQSKLWVTPSGAVVAWGGTLIAPPPANKTSN